ncbi:superoxide dismutase [Chitinophaga silvisoli]|uniref:Superoxide dismutase n=1 Tax=Chitinophaga silvisoli TaxID=2291814 RepID=A0A3E1NXL6_9BACT|nr:superoxide dismutase [Chitinophaga silvisoli]RFM32665.1 superoxide dismutase [Chitinophaga silvisoli]
MNRKQFLKGTVIAGGASLLQTGNVFASATMADVVPDKLVDSRGQFILNPLPYSKTFLEPYMDTETLHLHHDFHHGGAVKGANKDMLMIEKAIADNNLETVDFWTKKLSYHFGSHLLHTIFWTNLSNKKTEPGGQLLKQIETSFGSYERLKGYIAATAKNIDGNGWGVLAYQPYTKGLSVIQCENHEKLQQWGAVPLLVIDVWEHAYYLKYKNKRQDFVDTLFNIINWDNVADRLNGAVKIS